jgi:hypothetical protein
VDAVAVRVRALGTPAAVALLAVALLAVAETARAQCDPTTMTEGQKERLALRTRDEIVDLEEVKRKIEVEHHVLLVAPDGVILATPEQAGGLFGAAVFKGGVHPDSIPSLIRTIRVITNIYLRDHIEAGLKKSRACLERIGQPPPPRSTTPSAAASQIDWPVPMDWIAVKGEVRGSYVAECAGYRDRPAFRSAGTWRLEFLGDGQVRGVFGDDARQYSGLGAIKADGSASGESRSSNAEVPHLKWTTQFQRTGVDLVISSHTLDLWPAERGPHSLLVECKPGDMRQE